MKVVPTKATLLRLKEEKKVASTGYELLDRKRQVLVMELMKLIYQYRELSRQVAEKFRKIYSGYMETIATVGEEAMLLETMGSSSRIEVLVSQRTAMGVPIYEVEFSKRKLGPAFPVAISPSVDVLKEDIEDMVQLIPKWVSLKKSLLNLASEIIKTQKRVNALEKIFLPEYEEAIKFVSESLEEFEREEFFRMKMLKRIKGRL